MTDPRLCFSDPTLGRGGRGRGKWLWLQTHGSLLVVNGGVLEEWVISWMSVQMCVMGDAVFMPCVSCSEAGHVKHRELMVQSEVTLTNSVLLSSCGCVCLCAIWSLPLTCLSSVSWFSSFQPECHNYRAPITTIFVQLKSFRSLSNECCAAQLSSAQPRVSLYFTSVPLEPGVVCIT